MTEPKLRAVHVGVIDKVLMDASELLSNSVSCVERLIGEPLAIDQRHAILSVLHVHLTLATTKISIAREGLGEWKEERDHE